MNGKGVFFFFFSCWGEKKRSTPSWVANRACRVLCSSLFSLSFSRPFLFSSSSSAAATAANCVIEQPGHHPDRNRRCHSRCHSYPTIQPSPSSFKYVLSLFFSFRLLNCVIDLNNDCIPASLQYFIQFMRNIYIDFIKKGLSTRTFQLISICRRRFYFGINFTKNYLPSRLF